MFSVKMNQKLEKVKIPIKDNGNLKDEENEEGDNIDGVIKIISQLLVQWFDYKFNWKKSLIRQSLGMFFQEFVMITGMRCQIMVQAILRVVFCILSS